MAIAFDHLFICTTTNAPEVDHILACGFTEGTSNSHPGQGTTNRRIFFHNAMLEFLWVVNEREVRSADIAPTHLWERWNYRQTGYSPFGAVFRTVATSGQESYQLPFTTWNYRPPYLPPHLQIEVASDTHAIEPMIAVIPFGGRPDAFPADRAQPLNHACGAREISHVKITLPSNQPLSAAASAIQATGFVTFAVGDEYLAEVEFDRAVQGQMADFRPQLPLCLRW
jgi:hypothetical protein